MPKVKLRNATHIYAQPGIVTVSEAEAARLCSIGVAELAEPEPVQEDEEPAEPVKKPRKKKAE